jgi:hypothetical protein
MSLACIAAWALALLLLPAIALAWLAESRPQRIRRWRKQGLSWAEISRRLGCAPSTAKRWAMA